MKSIIRLLKYIIIPISFFLIIVFIISYKPLLNGSPIAHNDGSYYFNSLEKNDYINHSYSDDYFWSNLSSTVFLRTIKGHANLTLKKLWVNDIRSSYIMSFGMIFLVSIIFFFIFSNISKNIYFWYLAWVFVIFNNFTIESIAFWWYFYYSLGLIALSWLLYVIFKTYLKKEIKILDTVMLCFLWWIIILPIHLVIFFICIILYLIASKTLEIRNRKLLIISLILITWIHLYWIVPFIMNSILVSSTEVYWWNASGVLDWYTKVANYLNIISFRQYFNIISHQLSPNLLSYIYYIWMIWSIIWITFIHKSKKHYKITFLFFIMYFLFFNISIWPNSALSWSTFSFLWDNVSLFHFFRSFTRFIIILIPLILFIYAIHIREYNISKKVIVFVWILTIFIHNSLLTWDLKWVIPQMQIPQEYNEINDFLRTYKGNKNIIAYPNISYESYTWSISNSEKMRQDYYLKEYLINGNVIYNRTSLQLQRKSKLYSEIFSNNIQNDLSEQLSNSAIDLALVHKDYINILNGQPFKYEKFQEYFNTNSNIILDNEYYSLYEIDSANKNITLDSWEIKVNKINSTEYDLEINIWASEDILRFYRNFDLNWELKDALWNNITNKHRKHNDVFNKWIIEFNTLDKNLFIDNKDGTKTIKLKLVYKLESYLVIWKKISIWFILLVILLWIIWLFNNKKNEK